MKINVTNCKKTVKTVLKDPKKTPTYQVIVDMDDPTYMLMKAQENLNQLMKNPDLTIKEQDILIEQSINLLVYARTHRDQA